MDELSGYNSFMQLEIKTNQQKQILERLLFAHALRLAETLKGVLPPSIGDELLLEVQATHGLIQQVRNLK